MSYSDLAKPKRIWTVDPDGWGDSKEVKGDTFKFVDSPRQVKKNGVKWGNVGSYSPAGGGKKETVQGTTDPGGCGFTIELDGATLTASLLCPTPIRDPGDAHRSGGGDPPSGGYTAQEGTGHRPGRPGEGKRENRV